MIKKKEKEKQKKIERKITKNKHKKEEAGREVFFLFCFVFLSRSSPHHGKRKKMEKNRKVEKNKAL